MLFHGEPIGRNDPFGSISRFVNLAIEKELDRVITTDAAHTAIDIWVDSLGGDANAAFKLILGLRSRCRQLSMVIPDYAKSAATLVALGVDEIAMAPAAELGPLDGTD